MITTIIIVVVVVLFITVGLPKMKQDVRADRARTAARKAEAEKRRLTR